MELVVERFGMIWRADRAVLDALVGVRQGEAWSRKV